MVYTDHILQSSASEASEATCEEPGSARLLVVVDVFNDIWFNTDEGW
jgi:hypothetical protein